MRGAANSNGYNPMRWNCDASGCYNKKLRPKIEAFASALPGRIGMADVDATVEVNGHFLFIEWKNNTPAPLPIGQRIYAERLTKLSKKIKYVAVCGNAETMEVSHVLVIQSGAVGAWEPCDFEGLHTRICRWATSAKSTSSQLRAA